MTDDALGLIGSSVVEKYDIQRVVGEGGYAVVYRAEHRLWKRPVAIKVFKSLADLPEHARAELTQNFIREGALLAELSEKTASICQARDVGVLTTAAGVSVPYMVLEWLEGESLESALDREATLGTPPRTVVETIRLLEPVAEALALAHARGIAHRDVKPANIYLLGDARADRCPVKLLDFGIAKVVQDLQKAGGAFTKTDGTITSFTPGYAAPEQFARAHGPTGPWTDVFALALVAVELSTGRPALEGDSFLQLGYAAGDLKVRPTPRTRGVETSDAVEAVFQRALAVERTERYASADAFWRELRAAADLPDLATFGVPDRASALSFLASGPVDVSGHTVMAPSSRREDPVVVRASAGTEDALSPNGSTTAPVAAPSPPPPPSPLPPVTPAPVPAAKSRLLLVGGPLALLGVLAAAFALSSGEKPAPSVAAVPSASAPPPVVAASTLAKSPPPPSPCGEGMQYVPGGPFFMGSDEGTPAERPSHQVEVHPFCMDTFEVTTANYVACSDAGNCKRAFLTNIGEGLVAADKDAYDQACNQRDPAGRAQHPINCITWEMADTYCTHHQRRLPTEAEWEFAARGSDGRGYPWGDALPSAQHLNACGSECAAWGVASKVTPLLPMYPDDDHWPTTAPVGSFPEGRSKFGVMDLAGNVWEWVADWSGPYAAGDGKHPLVEPTGPKEGTRRVIRGGGWNGSEASWERPSFRYSKEPSDRSAAIGFRCAADVDKT